jgi:hypothetical protein
MNIKLKLQPPVIWGATFSQVMLMLPNALPFKDVKNIFFDVAYPFGEKRDFFNEVLDQHLDESYQEVVCKYMGQYTRTQGFGLGRIEDALCFNRLKKLCSLIKVREDIVNDVNDFALKNITNKTLGIHVRLGEMNILHPVYGQATTLDYIRRVDDILATEDIDSIFVASDNYETIENIQKSFNVPVSFYPEMRREEKSDFITQDLHMILDVRVWEEGFKDMLLLARCSQFLCRVSNLANASIIFSNTITKVHTV